MKKINFMLRFDQKGRGFYDANEFYKIISKILIDSKIATHVSQGSDPRNPLSDNDVIHVEVPYTVTNDIDSNALTIEHIREALNNVLDKLDKNGLYSNLKITEE